MILLTTNLTNAKITTITTPGMKIGHNIDHENKMRFVMRSGIFASLSPFIIITIASSGTPDINIPAM